MREHTKMRIPNKGYQANNVRTFLGTWRALALRYLGVDHVGRYRTKISGKQENLWGKRFYSAWLRWWDFTHVLGTGYFPFLVGHWKDSEVFREDKWIQRGIYSERMKVFRKHPLRAVPEEDFLHKKINTRDVFVVYASTVQKNDVFNLWRSDTIELDVGDQHFRNQVLESIIFFWSS